MGFLPTNFQLAMPFHSQVRVRQGIDRQTTTINDLCIWGRGIIAHFTVFLKQING